MCLFKISSKTIVSVFIHGHGLVCKQVKHGMKWYVSLAVFCSTSIEEHLHEIAWLDGVYPSSAGILDL